MEVYAGFSENADHNVGRVIDAIEELGELDNTLVIWIWGDNGASLEGTITGSFNEMTMQNGIPLTDEMQLQLAERYGGIEAWGGPIMDPHYSAAWAWAGNTPFQWGKQVGSHLGGTRNPMVIHWPERIPDPGGLRTQFTHATDVGATILDIAGIPAPSRVDGVEQEPLHGVTFADTLIDADAPERHTQQYFETIGNRAMYKDGWWLAMRTPRIPWVLTPEALSPYAPDVWDPDADPAELYYLPDDFTQAHDLSAAHPEKVQELKDLFWAEAERYKVLPLLATLSAFFGITPPLEKTDKIEFRGDVQNVAPGMIPRIYNRSYTISADLLIPPARRRRRHRRRSRPPRRVLALHRRRPAHPHLLDDGRVRLPPAGRYSHADRRGQRAHGVHRRRGQTRHRRSGHAVRQRRTRWAAAAWTTRCRCGSPRTPAWTSAATTAESSTSATPTGNPSPSPAPSGRSSSTSSRTQGQGRAGPAHGDAPRSRSPRVSA